MRQIAVSNSEARARWILAYVGGNALRHSREVPQPYDRHTQGTHWYMRGHARAKHGHARAEPRTRSRIPTATRPRVRGHARATQGASSVTTGSGAATGPGPCGYQKLSLAELCPWARTSPPALLTFMWSNLPGVRAIARQPPRTFT